MMSISSIHSFFEIKLIFIIDKGCVEGSMRIQANYVDLSKLNRDYTKERNVSFKNAATYAPRCYRDIRNLANAVYENSKGSQRMLMSLYKLRGENLNNMITAIGTAGVAPFFIRYNPFSHEDKDSRAYSAWRQPISAAITLGGQLIVMSNYNKLLDKHAAFAGVDEMDLRAKPPVSVLKPIAKLEYQNYKSECLLQGKEYLPRKKWIANRIVELQDEAYYKQLKELRETMDISKVTMKEIVKPSSVNSKADKIFKDVLKNEFAYSESELTNFKNFNAFLKNGKKIAKQKNQDLNYIQDVITSKAEDLAIKDLEECIKFESKVKYRTSLILKNMQDKFAVEKLKIMKKYSSNAEENKSVSTLNKIEKETKAAAKEIYENGLQELKTKFDEIAQKADANKTQEEKILEFAYKKVAKQGSFENIKGHGTTLEEVERSVKIKKWLNNRINLSETKLKVWKDRSGLVVGLLILPITCTILNWAYPKIMKKLFPRLSDVKEAKKTQDKEARQAELALENKAKEAK